MRGGVFFVDLEQVHKSIPDRSGPVDCEKMGEVVIIGRSCVLPGQGSELACDIPEFALCKRVDPQECPRRVVCPVPKFWIHLPIGSKTRVKGGEDLIVWGLRAGFVFEPSNRSGKFDGGVDGLLVGDSLEDP